MSSLSNHDRDASLRGGRLYKWACPVCGASNLGVVESGDPLGSGLRTLMSHVRAKDGNGHGARHAVPEEWSERKLRRHIEVSGS